MSQSIYTKSILGQATLCPVLAGVIAELNVCIQQVPNIDVEDTDLNELAESTCDISSAATQLRILYCLQGMNWMLERLLYDYVPKATIDTLSRSCLEKYQQYLSKLSDDLHLLEIEHSMKSSESWFDKWITSTGFDRKYCLALTSRMSNITILASEYLSSGTLKSARLIGITFVSDRIQHKFFSIEKNLRELQNITATNWIDGWKQKS